METVYKKVGTGSEAMTWKHVIAFWDGLRALPIALASTHWSPVQPGELSHQPCAHFLQQDGMIGMGAMFMAMKEHVSILLHRGRC